MSWWLWFEELQNGRGAGVSWWSWWCCWQKVIFLFLTWYVNKYNIHMTCRYYIWSIYVCIHALYIHLVSKVVKLATASTFWTMQPAFPPQSPRFIGWQEWPSSSCESRLNTQVPCFLNRVNRPFVCWRHRVSICSEYFSSDCFLVGWTSKQQDRNCVKVCT